MSSAFCCSRGSTGIGGRPCAAILAVHLVGATVGAVLELFVAIRAWSLLAGAALAAGLVVLCARTSPRWPSAPRSSN